ncbi:TPA: ATP-binding protein [Pseudomonas aeruginosa]
MWKSILAIALGAALGALLRWFLGLKLNSLLPSIPPGTLLANLVGGYVIGAAIAYFAQAPGIAPEWRLHRNEGACAGQFNAPLLRAVMGNLLRNATHYTDAGSITLTLDEHGFSVEDTGAGVPEEQRERIFMPFVRGSSSSGRGEGLGLGLSLVKRICAAEGWSVTLSAVEPHGCRFEVLLDVA